MTRRKNYTAFSRIIRKQAWIVFAIEFESSFNEFVQPRKQRSLSVSAFVAIIDPQDYLEGFIDGLVSTIEESRW